MERGEARYGRTTKGGGLAPAVAGGRGGATQRRRVSVTRESERASEGFVPDLQSRGSLSQGSGWKGLG
jgi:hypothetical protein